MVQRPGAGPVVGVAAHIGDAELFGQQPHVVSAGVVDQVCAVRVRDRPAADKGCSYYMSRLVIGGDEDVDVLSSADVWAFGRRNVPQDDGVDQQPGQDPHFDGQQ